jgi:hypothetical protein
MSGCWCACHRQPGSASNPQLCETCHHALGRYAPQESRTESILSQRRLLADRVASDRQTAKERAIAAGEYPSVSQRIGEHAKGVGIGWVLAQVWKSVIR